MKGLGTILNIFTVIVGSLLGLAIGSRFSKAMHQAVMNINGLVAAVIGIQMALETKNILIVLISLVLGTILGEIINIDGFINRIGEGLEKRFAKGEKPFDKLRASPFDKLRASPFDRAQGKGDFVKGYVTASILFCVGPMTMLGSIQDGLSGDIKLLSIKSVLDGFTSIIFASAMGIGVIFSTLTILVVQGGLTLFAGIFSTILTPEIIAEITATGGIMVVSTGINLLELKKIRTANMLPALIIVPILVFMAKRLGGI